MKNILIILIALLMVNCSKEKKEIHYNNLLEKHISDEEIQNFLDELGDDYKYVEAYDMHFYNFETKGVELNFTDKDTLRIIYIKKDIIKIPFDLKISYTLQQVEDKIGKPDRYLVRSPNLIGFYIDKDLVVRYKELDSLNMENPVKRISIDKLDRKTILDLK
ncbi:MAG: hypothetical protein WBM92_12935 [Aureibaculum sp.]